MKTSTLAGLLLAASLAACAMPAGDGAAAQESDLGAEPQAAGLVAGSLDEEGVVILANDRGVDARALTAGGLAEDVARAIVAARKGDDGAPKWFDTLDAIDALPGTDAAAFAKLVTLARDDGFTEAPGFDAPDKMRFEIPDDLGHAPTSADVTVKAGFDGKSTPEVVTIVRSRLRNPVHPTNESFVNRTIEETHRAFSIATNNLFAPGSPHAAFVKDLGADHLTLLGTMSAVMPTILAAEKGGATTYYAVTQGRYAPIATPRYPVVMRARIRVTEPGVRVFYPSWKATVLAGRTGEVVEGGG